MSKPKISKKPHQSSDKRIDIAVYVSGDKILCDWKMVRFPTGDLTIAQELVDAEFAKAVQNGPTEG